ncbi:MAG TPA: TIGR03067 domain-containing protein [Gemmataceae bacterium]|nr:TIGR03067 domain-containing protein [Gemmataceae bacterium]
MYSLMIGLVVVVAAPAKKEEPKKDAPSLVGEWYPESAVRGGKPDNPPEGTSITFTAEGKCLLKEGKREKVEDATFKADPKKDPAEIDITLPEKGDHAIAGIYKFEKDTLILCIAMGADRPKEFASPAGSEVMLITLKRAK